MPKKVFYLNDEKTDQLYVSWGLGWKNTNLIHNGKQLGIIKSKDELKAGKEIILDNGDLLFVKLSTPGISSGLEITINGKNIPGSVKDAGSILKTLFIFTLFFGILSMVVGAIIEYGSNQEDMETKYGPGLYVMIEGAIYLVLGFLVKYQKSMIALIALTVLASLDVAASIYSMTQHSGRAPSGIFWKVIFIVWCIKGIKALRNLQEEESMKDILDR